MAGGAAMMRAADRGAGDAGRARELGQQRYARLRSPGNAKPFAASTRPRPACERATRGRREPVHLADLGLRRVGRHAREPVALKPVGFRRDQRAGDDDGVRLAGAAAHERAGDETFGFAQASSDRRHRSHISGSAEAAGHDDEDDQRGAADGRDVAPAEMPIADERGAEPERADGDQKPRSRPRPARP